MRSRHRLFTAGIAAIAAARADRWLHHLARGLGIVLMFHHVRPRRNVAFAPNQLLEITPEFLIAILVELRREGFDIVPIAAVPDRLRSDRRARPFAVLTFDDGYRDNVEYAWPILRQYESPWTIFVTAEFADGRGRLWWLELEQAIGELDRVVISRNGKLLSLPSRTLDEKQAAFDAVYRQLRAGPMERLRTVTAELASQAGISTDGLAAQFCLSWAELQDLAREPDVTIGAHTLSHPVLAKLHTTAAAREIAESKVLLERRLGRPIRHFAYPFGDRSSAGEREFRLVRNSGFATAMTSRPGHLFPYHADHLNALPRVSINGLFQNRAALRALFSGVPFLLWNRGRVAEIET
ncbi:polysaccharide deacetylase family protein [Bradyrhizobium australiense]|uniref:Chitooligosaccharide deacetylase n=1 Tax=Bradyrhizobium australiense TaxID=2721161 RepID=A0A7Y4LUD6_9BRAD|nr:polysaccharide deacetylase family protein [Bradyrhizobium australiense]NOJ39148.1 polysaccharide deacetylase family protein [Bradyrhizobium australiense]